METDPTAEQVYSTSVEQNTKNTQDGALSRQKTQGIKMPTGTSFQWAVGRHRKRGLDGPRS